MMLIHHRDHESQLSDRTRVGFARRLLDVRQRRNHSSPAAPVVALPRTLTMVAIVARLLIGPSVACAGPFVIDFEEFAAGHVFTGTDLPVAVTLTVTNNNPTHPQKAIVFDSACPTGCSGGDSDLRTPGAGIGNDTPQGKILIIAENDVDADLDGLVDDPDDEAAGGIIRFDFAKPIKILSVRVIDIEEVNEFPSGVLQETVDGGTVFLPYAEIGDNSAQTVANTDAAPARALEVLLHGTGGIDDVVLEIACGDDLVDAGEQCDPPDGVSCSESCQIIADDCGNGTIDPGEECDDGESNADTTPNACRSDCTLPACGDGVIDDAFDEQCDPPDAVSCSESCQIVAADCGNGTLDPGEECDDGQANADATPNACRSDCTLPVCGDGVIDDAFGEQCDPPGAGEICDNMVDDDGIGGVDCEDPSCLDFDGANPWCGASCTTGVCTVIRRDPAVIMLPRDDKPGFFRVHGRVVLNDRSVDPVAQGFGISIRNAQGEIWSARLGSGELLSQGPGNKRFRYQDQLARDRGGSGRSGLYRVSTRLRRVNGSVGYAFTVQAYSNDFARATEARMTVQVYAVAGVGFLTADWKSSSRGWYLRNFHFR